jgi:hypothetical protein
VKRLRIDLRLMFLLVAFCAVLFAWMGAKSELRRINLRGELEGMELWREFAVSHPDIYTTEQGRGTDLKRLDALIAEQREKLGDSDP